MLKPQDFDFVRHLVQQRAAILIEPGKESLVESRLNMLVRRSGAESVSDLMAKLRGANSAPLRQQLVEAMTTNETLFFRDVRPFEALRTHFFPELFIKRKSERRLNIWCAGCSSGQEPYSLAILLKENFPNLQGWTIRILACDISKEMITRGKQGRYSQFEVNRGLPAPLLIRYFRQDGAAWQVREEIRRMVEFSELNLTDPWPPLPMMDIIFLRNVLIYFDQDNRRKVLNRARGLLKPDGCLFLGTAESPLNLDDAFERVSYGKSWCYRLPQA